MKKFFTVMMMALVLCFAALPQVQASWLSKNLDKILGPISTTSTPTMKKQPTVESVSKSGRWALVYKGEHYNIYVDEKSMKASGEAQNRQVEGYFKREYNAVGSQWLGNTSNGKVKPDVITHSIYKAVYYVNSASPYWSTIHYYDVYNHIIYQGSSLRDFDDETEFGNYIPDSPNEQIKNELFHAYGWDY